jgi:hypothetical protein
MPKRRKNRDVMLSPVLLHELRTGGACAQNPSCREVDCRSDPTSLPTCPGYGCPHEVAIHHTASLRASPRYVALRVRQTHHYLFASISSKQESCHSGDLLKLATRSSLQHSIPIDPRPPQPQRGFLLTTRTRSATGLHPSSRMRVRLSTNLPIRY